MTGLGKVITILGIEVDHSPVDGVLLFFGKWVTFPGKVSDNILDSR